MGNLCGGRPKSEDKPKPAPAPARALTEEETQLINTITSTDSFTEAIGATIFTYQSDPILFAKYAMLFGNNQFNEGGSIKREYTTQITNEFRSGRLVASTLNMADIRTIIAPIMRDIILTKSTTNFTRDQAVYFNSLIEEVGEALNNYNTPNNNPDYNSALVNKLYALSNENPRRPLSDAASNAVNHLVTTFNLTLNPANTETNTDPTTEIPVTNGITTGPTTETESFKNKNNFIMKLFSNASTEAFRNKKGKKRNEFTGYSLEHSALLPKDYADF